MKARLVSWVGFAFVGLVAACADLTPPLDAGVESMSAPELLTRVCAKCHGPEGIASAPNYPHLAGQQSDYIAAQLMNFRDHSRSDPLAAKYMWPIAERLSDVQIQGLAEILSNKALPEIRNSEEAEMAAGRTIYFEGINRKGVPSCVMCHGPNGEGFGAFPRLARQHKEYMTNQLGVFRSGRGRPDTPMGAIAPNLSDEDIRSVTAFLQGMAASR
jgi:cytochrome c553